MNTYKGNILLCKYHKFRKNYTKNNKILYSETNYNQEPKNIFYKEANLIKLRNGLYVDINNINILSYLKLKLIRKPLQDNIKMGTTPIYEGCLFVDEESLKESNKEAFQLIKNKNKK